MIALTGLVHYFKILGPGVQHLATQEGMEGGVTLCNAVITQIRKCKVLSALEGDECVACAAQAFRTTDRPSAH
jgi:hypothetical protein